MSTDGVRKIQKMFYGATMAIGKRIVERLVSLGWSRNDLMTKVPDLTPQALSNLIKRDSARSEWDMEIAEALGVSVLWLVYGIDTTYQAADNVVRLEAREPAPLPYPFNKLIDAAEKLTYDGQILLVGRALEMASTYGKAKANPVSS